MPDQNFGPLLAFSDVEDAVLEHYRHWLNIWLAARERHLEMPVGTIARPRSYIVKQTFTALPGEERTPIVIAVSDGLQDEPQRRGSGRYDVFFRFGIVAVVLGTDGVRVRSLAGHYQAALLGIALKHRSINDGQIVMNEFRDLRIEDIDEEAIGRSMAAVRIEVTYRVIDFAEDFDPPAFIDPPVEPPQPDDPFVEDVIIDVQKEALTDA